MQFDVYALVAVLDAVFCVNVTVFPDEGLATLKSLVMALTPFNSCNLARNRARIPSSDIY